MNKIMAVFGFVLAGAACAYGQSQYAFTSKPSVNVRVSPSTTAAKIGSLAKGVMVPLVEADWETGWNKVEFEGKTGYVAQSVSDVCDAVVPAEMLGKDITSAEPLNDVYLQGSICITPFDKEHAVIQLEWMRKNLPAVSWHYLADLNSDGSITATRLLDMGWEDNPSGGYEYLKEASESLDTPIRVGYDEYNGTLYFDGTVYSLYD